MTQTPILLVRHGETPWNARGCWQGHGNPSLSALGRIQVEEVARHLRAESRPAFWQGILSSDLCRAVETAEVLGGVLGLSVETDPRLRELDVGQWTGLTRKQIEELDAERLKAFESGDPDAPPGQGETRRLVRERAYACLKEWHGHWSGAPQIVVTHLGVIRALVPGAEPKNAECLPVVAEEILAAAPKDSGIA